MSQRFIPNYSSLCRPLWLLLAQNTFKWNQDAIQAFNSIHEQLAKPITFAYFDNMKPTILAVDAGHHCLGATLMQEGNLVACASRKLSPTECRYSQIEKEFLAIVFGIHRFRSLRIGQFKVTSDHKPLLPVFKRQVDTLPLRIRRMLALQSYDFDIEFISGKNNCVADSFSRNPILYDSSPEETIEYFVCFILTSAPVHLRSVAKETLDDPKYKKLIQAIGNWSREVKNSFPQLYSQRNELSTKECKGLSVICRRDRIIIPPSLCSAILQQAHASHFGIQKMKEVLRAYAWWD